MRHGGSREHALRAGYSRRVGVFLMSGFDERERGDAVGLGGRPVNAAARREDREERGFGDQVARADEQYDVHESC